MKKVKHRIRFFRIIPFFIHKKIILSTLFVLLTVILPAQQSKQIELSHQECVKLVIERNIYIRTARMDAEKSGYKINETRAILLPKVNLNGNFQDYFEMPVTLLPGIIVGQPGTNIVAEIGTKFITSASASITQVLYNQTALTALKLSKMAEELSGLTVEKASEELAYEISKLYFLALTTDKQKALVQDNINRTGQLSSIVKVLVDNGMGKQVDYDRISVSLENLYTQLSNAEATHEQQLNLIKYMLDIPLEEIIVLTGSAETPLLLNSGEMSDFSEHIDIRMLDAQKEINRMNLKMIKHGYLPTLSLTGQVAWQGYREEFKNYFRSNPENNWYSSSYFGINLSIPLFDGLEKRAKSQQAKLDYRMTEMKLDDTIERLIVDYQNARNNYENHRTNVERQQKNIHLAEKVYDETALKYREGLASMSDLLQDEMSLNSAQSGYLNALYSFKEAELKIMSLNGEIRQLFHYSIIPLFHDSMIP